MVDRVKHPRRRFIIQRERLEERAILAGRSLPPRVFFHGPPGFDARGFRLIIEI